MLPAGHGGVGFFLAMPTISVDGRTVTYDEAGTGPRPPLLLLHGFTGGRDDFAGVLDELGQDRRAAALDLPGHGGSVGPTDPAAYGLAKMAHWVLGCADALGFGAFHLLGHSLGGLLAQRVAMLASERLVSLVLLDTGLGALRESQAEHVVRVATAARDLGPEAALEASLEGQPPAGASERDRLLTRFRGLQPAAVVGGARALVGAAPVGAFLRGIDLPVLVVHGEDDEIWNLAEQRLLARTAAGARHVVIPGAGHSPQREAPAAFLAVVRSFLRDADEGS